MAFYDAPAIKSIQQGIATPTATSVVNVTINAIDRNKSILFFTYNNNGASCTGVVEGRINTSTQLTFDWVAASLTGNIYWYVIEFARGVSVQHIRDTTDRTGSFSVSINKVDPKRTFVITSFQQIDTGEGVVTAINADGTSLSCTADPTDAIQYKSWQVVQWNGAKVQYVSQTITTLAQTNVTIKEVDLRRALVISSTHTGNNDDRAVPLLTSSTNLQYNRYTAAGSPNVQGTFIAELPELNIQTGRLFIEAGTPSGNVTINKVFTSHSIPLTTPRGDGMSEGSQVISRTDRATFTAVLSGTTLTFTRNSTSGDTYVTWQVLEYKERLAVRKVKEYISDNDYSLANGYNVAVDKYTPEKTWHWAWSDQVRATDSWRFDQPGSKVVDDTSISVVIANSFGAFDFDPYLNVVEFDTGVTVQHLTDDNTARPHDIDINDVDLEHAGIFFQMIADPGTNDLADDLAQEATFVDSDTVRMAANTATTVFTDASIQVFDWHDAHNRVIDDSNNSADIDVSMLRLDPAKTFINGSSNQTNTTADVDRDDMKVYSIENTDTFNIAAGAARSLDVTSFPIMIDGPSQIRSQHKSILMTTTSGNISIDPVKLDRSFIIINGYNGNCGTAVTGGDENDTSAMQARAFFTSPSGIAITRANADVNATFKLSIVEVDPYPIDHFKRKCSLTIQGSQVEKTGTYPVRLCYNIGGSGLSNLPDEMFEGSGFYSSQLNGGDVRVSSDANGTGLLPLEIVDWYVEDNPVSGRAEAWVRVPLVSGTDKTIYVWYNTPGWTQQPSPWLDEGAYQVWPSGEYAYVNHMKNYAITPTGIYDSTQYDNTFDINTGTFTSRHQTPYSIGISGAVGNISNNVISMEGRADIGNLASSGYTCYVLATDQGDDNYELLAVSAQYFSPDQNSGVFALKRDSGTDNLNVTFTDTDGTDFNFDSASSIWSPNTEILAIAGMTDANIPFVTGNKNTRSTGSFGSGPRTGLGADQGWVHLFGEKYNAPNTFDGVISEAIIKRSEDGQEWDNTFYNTLVNATGFIVPGTPTAAWDHSVPITYGLLAQWDPSAADSLTLSGGDVIYVRDLATGFNLYKDSTVNAPSLLSNYWSNKAVINFDEGNDEALAMPWLPIEGADARFVWIVAKSNADSTDRQAFNIGTSVNRWGFGADGSSSSGDMEVRVAGNSVVTASGWSFNDGPQVYGIEHDGSGTLGGTWFYYGTLTEALQYDQASSATTVDTIQGSGINNWLGQEGSSGDTNDFWDGQIAEVLIYNRNLEGDERTAVFEYLRDKWLGSAAEALKVIIVPSWMFQPNMGLNR